MYLILDILNIIIKWLFFIRPIILVCNSMFVTEGKIQKQEIFFKKNTLGKP